MSTVTIFEQVNFEGRSQTLGPGKFQMNDLKLGNDRLTSIEVPTGWTVNLYEHANFQGEVRTLTGDVDDLQSFRDKTSSIQVIAPLEEKYASIFKHFEYHGKTQRLTPGRYNIHDLIIGNDKLSSIKVPSGLKVTLYEHENFRGKCRVYFNDSPKISDFNDKTSSIAVDEVADIPEHTSLNQFAWVQNTNDYTFGHNSIPNMRLEGFPEDTDYSRWAMLHDGESYRVYLFQEGSSDTIYQGAFNRSSEAYEFGFNSIPKFILQAIPEDADPSRFAMLHDGSDYRLYMMSNDTPNQLIQFAFDPQINTYVFGYRSIPRIAITDVPGQIDRNGWGMLHDGKRYRLYNWKRGEAQIYQASFNGTDYQFGYDSIPLLDLLEIPQDSNLTDFAMLYDGMDYRFYLQTL